MTQTYQNCRKSWGGGGGAVIFNGILKPSQTTERTHLFCVNSPNCSTKWVNLPPTGISGHGKIGSGKGWLSELCGRPGMLRERELLNATTPLLRKVLCYFINFTVKQLSRIDWSISQFMAGIVQ